MKKVLLFCIAFFCGGAFAQKEMKHVELSSSKSFHPKVNEMVLDEKNIGDVIESYCKTGLIEDETKCFGGRVYEDSVAVKVFFTDRFNYVIVPVCNENVGVEKHLEFSYRKGKKIKGFDVWFNGEMTKEVRTSFGRVSVNVTRDSVVYTNLTTGERLLKYVLR